MKNYHYKIIKTGKLFEFYKPFIPFLIADEKNPPKTHEDIEPKEIKTLDNKDKSIRAPEYVRRNAFRAQNKIRRLVQTNFDANSRFITLTFRDTPLFDINNPHITLPKFQRFIERLHYKYGEFKWLAVMEFQKRGAVHYHLIVNLPYVNWKVLENIWSHGFVKINRIDRSSKVGVYIAKYLSKEGYYKKYDDIRKFFYSNNLEQETIIYTNDPKPYYAQFAITTQSITFKGKYLSRYNGYIEFMEANLYLEGG